MSRLLFLDLETSGLQEKDRICEIGLLIEDGDAHTFFSSLCKSPKKISTEAMSLHHITNEMIRSSPECTQTDAYKHLVLFNSEHDVLIAHNISFDLGMLHKEGFGEEYRLIDTLRCSKALIPECEQFSLQFLRYELGLYKEEKELAQELGVELKAHRAGSDVLHTFLLYRHLLEYATLSELIEISMRPVLMQKLPFGKYSGRYIEEIAEIDPTYLHWLLGLEDLNEDLLYSIKHYLG